MINNAAIETITDAELKNQVEVFITDLKNTCGENLKSVILYGGVAKGDYTKGKSNTNMLLVLEQIDLDILDTLSLLFQKAISDFRFSPFLLTSSEVDPVKRVFAVKLFDIQQHMILLYGENVVATLEIRKEDLRFISEQELRNQLSRMKYFYIQHANLPEKLLDRIQKSFTTLLVNANTFFYLKTNNYLTTRDEIIAQLLEEPNTDKALLNDLLLLKKGLLYPDKEKTKSLYGQLMLHYKYIIKELEKLS